MNNKSRLLGYVGAGFLLLSASSAYANISGKAFRDFNGDGTFTSGASFNETGVAGVTVKAFDATGTQVATATSAADGSYTLSGLTSGSKYRLEFSWSGSWLKAGAAGGTSVQFVQDGATNADLALNALGEYSSPADPRMLVPTYRAGSGVGSTDPGIHSFLRSSTGLNANFSSDGTQGTGPIPGNDALIGQVGAVWGIAWQANKKRAFAASFLKRHVGLKNGLGYVYVLDESTNPGTVVGSFNLQGVTPSNGGSAIDLGSVCRDATCAGTGGRTGIAADYVIPVAKTSPSVDMEAFYKVGKVGFGDADMQPGTDMLWLVNANQQALISVDVSSDTVGSLGAAATVKQYPLVGASGVPTCTGGSLRPWALKFSGGKGYLGVTCDAFDSQNKADLKAAVLSFDPANISAGFSSVVSFPLNYTRFASYLPFYPWMNVDAANTPWFLPDGAVAYPQPLLSDIEIDDSGNLYLAIMDIFVHQTGQDNYKPYSGGSNLITGMATGDFLKICKVGSGFAFEGETGCPVNISNGTGPANGGQFFEDYAGDGRGESNNGALAFLHGSGQIDAITMDPHGDVPLPSFPLWSQGMSTYSLTTGKPVNAYELNTTPDSSFFGKGNGLGDIEVLTDPPPIEIGNRVWVDTNKNGLQDADEAGLAGVTVELKSGTSVIATATTAADGTYYFSNAAGTSTASKKYGLAQLQPNMAYTVHFPPTVTLSSKSYSLTTATAGGDTLIDSNAPVSGDVAVAASDIPVEGANNHSFDAGYIPAAASVDLEVTKVADKSSVKSGDTVKYTVTVTNKGPDAATGVEVTDKLPAGVTYQSHNAAQGTYTNGTGIWAVGSLAKDAKATLTIDVTVN